MSFLEVDFKNNWTKYIKAELDQNYLKELDKFLSKESISKTIYPNKKDVFNAFKYTDLKNVKIVILGQDPYHGEDQAHGLSFSVLPEIKTPPSLRNIYKEINADLSYEIPKHGHLVSWAKQGVLLLNAVLTVEKANAGSHQKKGWEQFTDKIIELINDECEGVVFLLWGSHAQKKGKNIDESKHHILKAPHPSPLSAHRGFLGCGHFSKANELLEKQNKAAIDWSIS